MLRLIYKIYRNKLLDLMVEDFYKDIPKDLMEPSIDFLAKGREKLEKFFLIQSYLIQRRSVSDIKNVQLYQGMLIVIKSLLVAISKGKKEEYATIETKKEVNPLDGVSEFLKKGIEFISTKKEVDK